MMCNPPRFRVRGRQLLLLYAVLGDTHLRHSQLKPLLFPFTKVKHNDFGTFSLQDASGAQMPPRCLPDVQMIEFCSNWVQEKDGGLRIGSSILTRRGGFEYDVPEAQNT